MLVGAAVREAAGAGTIVLRVLAVLLALTAVFLVIRTGHLGAKLAWGEARAARPRIPGGLRPTAVR